MEMQEKTAAENQPSQEQMQGKLRNAFKRYLALAILLSLLVGSVAGAVFGFVAGQLGTRGLAGIINDLEEKKFTNPFENFDPNRQSQPVINQNLVVEDQAVIDLVEKDSPAVVSIVITRDVPKIDQFFSNPFFDPFGFDDRGQEGAPSTEKQEIGGGTGFIIDPSGYIVTNKHVVQDTQAEYTVIMNDGKKLGAKVLARDPFNDMAVIKVEQNNLPTLPLGDSESLKIGQTVIAIGNSLGEFRNTVSKGIISGLKRNVQAGDGSGQSELLQEVIQTDAAINPGNSGGPLLDLKGEVVAINVAMAQGAQSIGFAIPINQLKKTLQSVKENGKISRPYLGIRYLVINEQIKQQNNLPFNYGALVIRGENRMDLAVIPGSPADKAGIVENDIILEIDGQKITTEKDLSRFIQNKNVGDEVTLKVWDKGAEKTVKLKLEEASN